MTASNVTNNDYSNEVSWRECFALVVEVELDAAGFLDLEGLQRKVSATTKAFSRFLGSVLFIGSANGQAQALDEPLIKNLEWRPIGPAVMGDRIDDVAVVEQDSYTIYIGAASGGVWKTTNNGTTWEPIFDHEGVASIGNLANAPSDPNLVWLGTGEPNNRQSSPFGDGIYKSTDAGRNWTPMVFATARTHGRSLCLDDMTPLSGLTEDVLQTAAHLFEPRPWT